MCISALQSSSSIIANPIMSGTSKQSFFSIATSSAASQSRQGSQSSTPRRVDSSGNLRRASKPDWAEGTDSPSSSRPASVDGSDSSHPPKTPPLRKGTLVKAEGAKSPLPLWRSAIYCGSHACAGLHFLLFSVTQHYYDKTPPMENELRWRWHRPSEGGSASAAAARGRDWRRCAGCRRWPEHGGRPQVGHSMTVATCSYRGIFMHRISRSMQARALLTTLWLL